MFKSAKCFTTFTKFFYPYGVIAVIPGEAPGERTVKHGEAQIKIFSNGKWSFETVRKLMPPVRSTKYNGYVCWKVKKRP